MKDDTNTDEPEIMKYIDTQVPVEISKQDYFTSYEDLDVHRLMLQDQIRTTAYMDAVYNSKEYFEGKIVMDVGAGTGILSLFCAKAGAKKVYAVEASGLGKILPDIFEKNGFTSVVQVLHSKVEDIEIDSKVDIIISEWMGFYLFHESMLDSVLFARDKFLKPDGLMYPNTAIVYAAPCSVPELDKNIEFWKENQYGFDLSPIGDIEKLKNKPEICEVNPENILSDTQLLWEFDLTSAARNSLQSLKDRRFFSIEMDGNVQGICIWFSVGFPSDPEKEESTLPTGPWDPITHWKQTVIKCPNSIPFEEGDIIGWEFEMEKDISSHQSRSYKLKLEFLDSETEEHPIPCECGIVKCEIIKEFMKTGQGRSETSE